MQSLPLIHDPARYEGLFAYDFGTHVSVGYTATEILILRKSTEFRAGTAFQIYRVNDHGGMELRGIQDSMLLLRDCVCFLQSTGENARHDYERLAREARGRPLPIAVEARLMRSYAIEPPNLSAIIFPAWAGHRIAGWLGGLDWSPGERVISGTEALASMDSSGGLTIDTCTLVATVAVQDRDAPEVLATTHLELQR